MTRLRTSHLLLSFAGGAVALSLVGCGAAPADAAPSALVESAYEPPGQNCENGGAVITFGVDDNGDNDIQDGEITSRQYVCDGVDGVQGEAGPDGAAGQNGAAGENGADGATPLVANRAATSEECAAGGYVFMTGFDDGAGDGSTAGDGVLSAGEVDASQLVCNGSMGAEGAAGADGATTLTSVREATAEECPTGGSVLMWGLDVNRDGNLDAATDTEAGDSGVGATDVDGDGNVDTIIEVTNQTVICNVTTALDTRLTAAEGTLATLEGDVSGLQTGLSQAESDIDGLQTDVSALGAGLTTVNGEVSDLGIALGALETRVVALETAVSDLDATYATDADVATLLGGYATMSDLSAVQAGATSAYTAALNAQFTADTAEQDAGLALAGLNSLGSRVSSLETAVDDDTLADVVAAGGAGCTDGFVVTWNDTDSAWECAAIPATDLSAYTTTAGLTTLLGGYVTTTGLTTTLAGYVTPASLSTTLGAYTTTTGLNTLLGNYATMSDLSTVQTGATSAFTAALNAQFTADTAEQDAGLALAGLNSLGSRVSSLETAVDDDTLADVVAAGGAGCTDGFVVTWNDTDSVWECAAIPATDLSAYTTTTDLTTLLGGYVTTTALSNVQNDVADVQGDVTNALIGVNNLDTRVFSLESSLVSLGYVESTVTHMSDDLKYGSGCANGDVLVWDPAVQPAGAWKCETPVDADTLGGISCPVDGDTVQFVAGTWVCDSRTNTIYQDLYDPMHGLLSPFTGLPGSIPYWDGVRWQKAFTDLFNDGMGRIGIGTSTPVTTLDVRSTSGDGDIAVGGSAKSAADAGAGAIRYSSGSGGVLEYSNGTAWNTLTSTVSKSLVSGTFDASTYANAYFGELAATEVTDVNGDFALGRFTAPRTGNYTFTATVSTTSTNDMVANGTWELQFDPDIGDKYVSRFVSPAAATGYTATVTGAYTVNLTAGEQVRFMVYNSTGSSKTIAGPDYNRFSIVEN